MEAWIKTDAARIPARLPAFAHSFDEFIREQILNILWKDETDQLPAPTVPISDRRSRRLKSESRPACITSHPMLLQEIAVPIAQELQKAALIWCDD